MKKKMLAFGICALILFSILNSGCITEDNDNKESEPSGPITLNDAPTTLNKTDKDQRIAFLLMSGEPVKKGDLRFQMSKDGATYYIIETGTTQPTLKIKCEKVEIDADRYWGIGETIWFYEDGANYEPGTYFYCKIIHASSLSPAIDLRIMVY